MNNLLRSTSATVVLTLLFGVGIGVSIGVFVPHHNTAECEAQYQFLNASVVCGEETVLEKTSYRELRERIEERISTKQKEGGLQQGAVYFRDLRQGPVFGINETMDFAPASLMKLPIALVYLDAAEQQPELLDAKMQFEGETAVKSQRLKPEESAQPGTPYPIKELLRLMLTYSDNASYEALEAFLEKTPARTELRLKTLQELGFIDPRNQSVRTVSVRGYAALLILLYNATYLDAEYSESVLSWLRDSPFREGIVAGVPDTVAVAHKFGERLHEDDSKELHDCGIIYYPGNPYSLCVMTLGTDWEVQRALIRDISDMVYSEVDSRRL
ncbi:MAG: serine hydrolase [Candidatus Pacebacteria bacterium]|nr:serine hydrolase [Candidatus Paceibacterota bacterium]